MLSMYLNIFKYLKPEWEKNIDLLQGEPLWQALRLRVFLSVLRKQLASNERIPTGWNAWFVAYSESKSKRGPLNMFVFQESLSYMMNSSS